MLERCLVSFSEGRPMEECDTMEMEPMDVRPERPTKSLIMLNWKTTCPVHLTLCRKSSLAASPKVAVKTQELLGQTLKSGTPNITPTKPLQWGLCRRKCSWSSTLLATTSTACRAPESRKFFLRDRALHAEKDFGLGWLVSVWKEGQELGGSKQRTQD